MAEYTQIFKVLYLYIRSIFIYIKLAFWNRWSDFPVQGGCTWPGLFPISSFLLFLSHLLTNLRRNKINFCSRSWRERGVATTQPIRRAAWSSTMPVCHYPLPYSQLQTGATAIRKRISIILDVDWNKARTLAFGMVVCPAKHSAAVIYIYT